MAFITMPPIQPGVPQACPRPQAARGSHLEWKLNGKLLSHGSRVNKLSFLQPQGNLPLSHQRSCFLIVQAPQEPQTHLSL